MGMGHMGTYVLTSDQTTLDGAPALPGRKPRIGQAWRWQGEAVRLDGPQSVLVLGNALGEAALRGRVSRSVKRRFELASAATAQGAVGYEPLSDGFAISDGTQYFRLIPISVEGNLELGARQLIWCPDGAPLSEHDYIVTRVAPEPGAVTRSDSAAGDVICFTQGTRILTDVGLVAVEHLYPGARVMTRDNGAQEVLWIGKRHITGARLHAMPQLRPVRVRAEALDQDMPDGDLLLSPDHRILFSGANAQALFNSDEVLVAARDLVNDHSVLVDHSVPELSYYHLMFAEHQVIWANNVATESFFPANTKLETISDRQRADLLALFPDLARDPHSYGPPARRMLSKADAALMAAGGA